MVHRSRRSLLRALGGAGFGIGLSGCLGAESGRPTETTANAFISAGALTIEPGGARLTGQLRADDIAARGFEGTDRVDPNTGVFFVGGDDSDTDRITFADGSLRALAVKLESGDSFDVFDRGTILAEERTSFSTRFGTGSGPAPAGAPVTGRPVLIDDFEDGDTAVKPKGWGSWHRPRSGETGGRISTTRDAIDGSFSGEFVVDSGTGSQAFARRDEPTRLASASALVRPVESGSGDEGGGFAVMDGPSPVATVGLRGGGNVIVTVDGNNIPIGTYTNGRVYEARLRNLDFDAGRYDASVVRASDRAVVAKRTGVPFRNDRDSVDTVAIPIDYDRNRITRVFDNVVAVEA